jgi:hypothetical protein
MTLDDIYLEMNGEEDVDLHHYFVIADPHPFFLTIDEKLILMFEDLSDVERFVEKIQNEVDIMKRSE